LRANRDDLLVARTVSQLVARNANVNAEDMHGRRPLHYAAMSGNAEVPP